MQNYHNVLKPDSKFYDLPKMKTPKNEWIYYTLQLFFYWKQRLFENNPSMCHIACKIPMLKCDTKLLSPLNTMQDF